MMGAQRIPRRRTVAVSVLLAAGALSLIALSVGLAARALMAWLDVSVFGLESPIDVDLADDVDAFPLAVGSVIAGAGGLALSALALPAVRRRAAAGLSDLRSRVRGRRCARGHRLLDGERVCPICEQQVA